MRYLNLDLDYFNHPKTIQLTTELGGHRAEVLPLRLWAHVGKYHCDNGIMKGYTPASLAKILNWKEDPDKLIKALIKTGFIERTRSGLKVHDWTEHSGHLAAFRERARHAAKIRWSPKNQDDSSSQPEQKPKKNGKKTALRLTEDQIREVRITLAKNQGHALMSQANEQSWQELEKKIEQAQKKKPIRNLYAYAISAARNGCH